MGKKRKVKSDLCKIVYLQKIHYMAKSFQTLDHDTYMNLLGILFQSRPTLEHLTASELCSSYVISFSHKNICMVRSWCWTKTPSWPWKFQYIPNFSRVEVRVLCRSLEFLNAKLFIPCLYGPGFAVRWLRGHGYPVFFVFLWLWALFLIVMKREDLDSWTPI